MLTAANIHGRWSDVQERAGVPLIFSQFRKMGYNKIKGFGGKQGPLMAEFWDGHANAASKEYDDGVWAEMNEAERSWADELREQRILICHPAVSPGEVVVADARVAE